MDPIVTVVIKKLTPGVIAAMPNLFASSADAIIQGNCNMDSYSAKEVQQNDAAVTRGLILGKQLGNKLQLRNADRSLKSTRLGAGKIDRRLVAQLGFDNANVFHRIVTDRFKNYFIHISIDASGSMHGNKLRQAITSAVAIAQAASMTTGIRVQISVRGTESQSGGTERCITIYAYDSAHDKMSKIRNYFKYLSTYGCTPEGLAFKSIEKDLRADARGDELIFINYSDGAPTNVTGVASSYNGVTFTRKVVNEMREIGMNIISYFIYEQYIADSDNKNFKTMYGPDSQFIRPDSVVDIAKTINQKFLEIAK
jgi:nitric oxide reductase activation protein